MLYVRLDAHRNQSTICALDGQGKKILSRTVDARWSEVLEEVGKVGRPFAICFEASTGYGYLYGGLQEMTGRVLVAHPGRLRPIFRSKRKNDRTDA